MTTWFVLRRLLTYQPGAYALNALLWGVFWMLPLATGLIMREIFNQLGADGSALWWWLALLVAAALARIVINATGTLAWASFWFSLLGLLRRNLLGRILARPGAKALIDTPSEAVSRFRDDVDEIGKLIEWTVDGVGIFVAGVVGATVMFLIDPVITTVVLVPLVALIGLVSALRRRILAYRQATREATGRVTDFVGEMFGAVQAVKVAAAEEQVVGALARLNEARRNAALRDALLTELLMALFGSIITIGTGLILLLAARAMRAGTFTVGDFALFVFYLGLVTEGTTMVGNFVARFKQTGVSINRLTELLQDDRPELLVAHTPIYLHGPLPEPTVPGQIVDNPLRVLEARGLSYRDPVTGRGIEDVDLTVRRGSIFVITGRIGSGKTTVLRVLLGLLPRQAGQIYWNGREVLDPASFLVPPRAAYVPQVPRLFSDSLRDNILMGVRKDGADLTGAVRAAVLERDVEALEHGLETLVGPRGVKLSGGQIQRTAAARMFVRAPELLVVDDLSSALDVETEAALWERLFAETQITCLIVSHRRIALTRADNIVVLEEGRVVGEGTLEAVLQTSTAMKEIWEAGAR